jgi:N-formylglutamate amidohydrolase
MMIKQLKPKGDYSGLVFDSPHSGLEYPEDFYFDCEKTRLDQTADHYVDELFDFAPNIGAPLIVAKFPRSYVDVNRARNDLDPLLINDIPHSLLGPLPEDYRSPVGYGVIRRLVKQGDAIYSHKLEWAEVEKRLQYYDDYRNTLDKHIAELKNSIGKIIHINCHSMPSKIAITRSAGLGLWSKSVDICLGNLNGLSADSELLKKLEVLFKTKGYRVSLNDPYSGADIIRSVGKPLNGVHSIQVEISKSLYMNEKTFEKTSNFNVLKADLANSFKDFICG